MKSLYDNEQTYTYKLQETKINFKNIGTEIFELIKLSELRKLRI